MSAAPVPLRPHAAQEVIRDFANLPAYRTVISGRHGDFNMSEGDRAHYVVVEVANNAAAIFVSDGQTTSHKLFSIKQALEQKRFSVNIVPVDKSLIRLVYERTSAAPRKEATPDFEVIQSKIVADFDEFIEKCVGWRVSDVHWERRDQEVRVRVRRNGVLELVDTWTPSYTDDMTNAIYNACSDKGSASIVFGPREPQRAAITRATRAGMVKIRFQSTPGYPEGNYDVVMRLQVMGSGKSLTLAQLGYEKNHHQMLDVMMKNPNGAIILAGTTGSGKSTTIFNMLRSVAEERPGAKIFTVEDPPEFFMPFASQIPVPADNKGDENVKKKPFLECLKATMRADPDILMVGEVRDGDTAVVMAQAILTGHQVYTTVHADSGIGIVKRLEDLGLDRNTLAYPSFLVGLIYQKLVPILCTHCKVKFDPKKDKEAERLMSRLEQVAEYTKSNISTWNMYEAVGCPKCSGKGISGRAACAEMVLPDKQMREMFRDGNYEAARQYWRSMSRPDKPALMMGRLAVEHGLYKVSLGDVSPYHLEDEFGVVTLAVGIETSDVSKLIGDDEDELLERLGDGDPQ